MLTRDQIKTAWHDNCVRMNDDNATLLVQAYRYWRQNASPYLSPGHGPRGKYAIAKARADVAKNKRRYPGPLKGYRAAFPQSEKGQFAIENLDNAGLRYVGRVIPETPRDVWDTREQCGWFTNPHGDVFSDGTGLIFGVVFQLPARRGVARFVAGWQQGGTDAGPVVDLSEIFEEPRGGSYWDGSPTECDAAREAARRADDMARKAAEDEREYQTAWQAGLQWADADREALDARAELLAVLKERREAMQGALPDTAYHALCAALRSHVESLLESIRDARERRDTLASGDHTTLIFFPSKRLRDAFNEGAGESVI